jgi:hypothetical protein
MVVVQHSTKSLSLAHRLIPLTHAIKPRAVHLAARSTSSTPTSMELGTSHVSRAATVWRSSTGQLKISRRQTPVTWKVTQSCQRFYVCIELELSDSKGQLPTREIHV